MPEQATLDQWLARIEAGHPSEIELGLERVSQVAERLAINPGKSRVITVAGTNGKGSTLALLDSILSEAGYATGVYTSPHLLRYNERIRIRGIEASDQAICDAFEAIDHAREGVSLTYFEFGTLAALYLFQQANLDFYLLEVGMGGRLDAVNLIDPDLALITSLSFDHQDWLGDTLDKIGFEKAGIFRSDKPAICGLNDPPESVLAHAEHIGAQLHMRGRDFEWEDSPETELCWRGASLGSDVSYDRLPVPHLPKQNAATALQAIALLQPPIPVEAIRAGLAKASLAGRMQGIRLGAVELMLDVAHNPESAEYLSQRLAGESDPRNNHLVVGMLKDKDQTEVFNVLDPIAASWHLVDLPGSRGSRSVELAQRLDSEKPVRCYSGVSEALESLIAQQKEGDRILVCGSFVTVTEALSWLSKHPVG